VNASNHTHGGGSSAGSHGHSGGTGGGGSHAHSKGSTINNLGSGDGFTAFGTDDDGGTVNSGNTGSGGGHSHSISLNAAGSHSHGITNTLSIDNTGNATETRPRNIALLACIKT